MLVKKYWRSCFLFLLISDAIALIAHSAGGHFLFKLLLMPVLMTGLLHSKKALAEKNWRLILAGLVTAWAGDVLLLFSEQKELFFILGLLCFLCTHLAYIIYFKRYHRGIFFLIKKQAFFTSMLLLFTAGLLAFLWNGLGALLIPVIIYTVVIVTMLLHAFAAKSFVTVKCGNYFIAGGIAFILSDSLLAIAKFHLPFFLSGVVIMITYGLAQLLIVDAATCNTDDVQVNQKTTS